MERQDAGLSPTFAAGQRNPSVCPLFGNLQGSVRPRRQLAPDRQPRDGYGRYETIPGDRVLAYRAARKMPSPGPRIDARPQTPFSLIRGRAPILEGDTAAPPTRPLRARKGVLPHFPYPGANSGEVGRNGELDFFLICRTGRMCSANVAEYSLGRIRVSGFKFRRGREEVCAP